MKKYTLPLIFLLAICVLGHAQTAADAEDLYYDFSQSRMMNDVDAVVVQGEQLLGMLDKLSEARQKHVVFYLANAYENTGQMEKAVPLYEKTIEAEPDYYVPYRALGYHYLAEARPIGNQINASKDASEREKLIKSYQSLLRKALPYLEKDYACDPFDGSLETIQMVMRVLGAEAKPEQFDQRIEQLATDCLDLLPSEG